MCVGRLMLTHFLKSVIATSKNLHDKVIWPPHQKVIQGNHPNFFCFHSCSYPLLNMLTAQHFSNTEIRSKITLCPKCDAHGLNGLTHSILSVFSPAFPCSSAIYKGKGKKKSLKKQKHTEKWTFQTVLLESWFRLCICCKSFTWYLGSLHSDENKKKMSPEPVTHGAGSIWKYAASEPKTKTAAELRIQLHR